MTTNFSMESMQTTRKQTYIAKMLKEKISRILYPVKIPFVNEGKLKTFFR